jgi:hypothetical protein
MDRRLARLNRRCVAHQEVIARSERVYQRALNAQNKAAHEVVMKQSNPNYRRKVSLERLQSIFQRQVRLTQINKELYELNIEYDEILKQEAYELFLLLDLIKVE